MSIGTLPPIFLVHVSKFVDQVAFLKHGPQANPAGPQHTEEQAVGRKKSTHDQNSMIAARCQGCLTQRYGPRTMKTVGSPSDLNVGVEPCAAPMSASRSAVRCTNNRVQPPRAEREAQVLTSAKPTADKGRERTHLSAASEAAPGG